MSDPIAGSTHSSLPLDGVRMVGFTHLAAGPYALSMLGDMGADVINIEPPRGDTLRGRDAAFEEMSSYFLSVNRSKRAVSLDLKHPEGLEVARKLIASSDVLVENYRVGAMDRLQLGYEQAREINPRIVYVSVTPWGLEGPMKEDVGMDLIAQARGGIMGLTGEPGRRPVRVPPPIADYISSYLTCFAVMLGLRSLETSSVGQHIETSLLGGQVASMANLITYFARTGEPSEPVGSGHPQLVPCAPFRTADGFIVLACVSEDMWQKFCLLLAQPGLAEDPRFRLNVDRTRNAAALTRLLDEALSQHDTDYWLPKLSAVGIPSGRISTLSDLMVDPQVIANRYIVEEEHPVVGALKLAAFPISFSAAVPRRSRPAALLSQHAEEVLRELDYGDEEIAALLGTGAVTPAQTS
jgi:crotonobetainyl-CoA:carnitine CoA-transferase CaiB-like acyl-CoA transferase